MTKRVGHIRTSVQIPAPVYERMEKAAAERGLSRNALINIALAEWLQRNPPEKQG
jgi:metal-responsive CopG/Arc/MetJ family transcriptional regulator